MHHLPSLRNSFNVCNVSSAAGDEPYSGIGSAMKKLGHTLYDPATFEAKLTVQHGINPTNATSRLSFRDFAISDQPFCVYLAMLGGQPHVTMIHTPGAYYSINSATSAYQGWVLAFIGDQRASKEPNPVCMPTTKTWEWFSSDVVTNFAAFEDHYAAKTSRGTQWMPVVGEDTSDAIQVPHLLAIPNILVDLLCTQGMAITPHEVLMMVDNLLPLACTPLANNGSAFVSGALWWANLGPMGRARSSWKQAPSPLMMMILTPGWEIVLTSPWGHAPVAYLRRRQGRRPTGAWIIQPWQGCWPQQLGPQ